MNSIIIAFAILLGKLYEMIRIRFQTNLLTLLIVLFSLTLTASNPTPVLAQQPTDLTSPQTGIFITVVTDEPQINIRMGPSSTVYPIVGTLLTGSTAPALGRSQGGDWIQIEFPSAPGGVGWVYSPLVQVSPPGTTLQVVAPPPTPVPPATATIDPTLAAQFIVEPTGTRLPTFTPPPTLASPSYVQTSPEDSLPLATVIIALGVLGIIGFLLSLLRR
ncbi:MAG: SH3 domain-containing protein [Anaerolineales bacterium]|nr:SH3 domain-containing protein [Anaerolineales bacterium]